MAEFFKTSTLWVVDYRFDGRPRRWYRALSGGQDPTAALAAELQALHGARAQLVSVRPATEAEEIAYQRGEAPVNHYCPVGRG